MARPKRIPKRITNRDRWRFLLANERGILADGRQANIKDLLTRLLEIDGDFAILPCVDPTVALLLEYGQVWHGPPAELSIGQPSQCHTNSAVLWDTGVTDGIGTGYALSYDEDGIRLWRAHSWGFKGDLIVETTNPREIYFGIQLRGEGAAAFAASELF